MRNFVSEVSEKDIRHEKENARRLRTSAWWKKKRQSGVCYFCGKTLKPPELTMEHIVPIIRGGKSIKSNLVPSCKDCNNRKKYMLPSEWQEYMKRLKD